MIIYYVVNTDYNNAVYELEVIKETKQLYYLNPNHRKLLFGYGFFSYSQLNKGDLCFLLECDAIAKAKQLIVDKIDHLQSKINRLEQYL